MRKGKYVNLEDPIYLLDKQRGSLRLPTYSGDVPFIELRNLKFKNRQAFDENLFELRIGEIVIRIHKDELSEAQRYI